MKKTINIILISLATIDAVAQANLVPNPSFEVNSSCPPGAGYIGNATPWYSATISTPDYFNSCNTIGMGVPLNSIGYQNARTGIAYAGIGTYVFSNPNFRDYIEAPLLDSLVPGRKYLVSFYVSPVDKYIYSTNTIGLLLTTSAVSSGSSLVLPYTPQIENDVNRNLTDTALWYLISDTIIASGGEKYVTIGNFETATNSGIDSINTTAPYAAAYYFVDDVSITDLSVGINENDDSNYDFSFYPNPNNGILQFNYSSNECSSGEIIVYDLTGKRLRSYSFKGFSGNLQMNETDFEDGIYFYTISIRKKIVKSDKFIIIR